MNRKPSICERLDPDVLRRMYILERKTINEVAGELHIGRSSVLNAMIYWRIPRRVGNSNKGLLRQEPDIDENALRQLYLEKFLTIGDIASRMHVSPRVVRRALDYFRIPVHRGRRRMPTT